MGNCICKNQHNKSPNSDIDVEGIIFKENIPLSKQLSIKEKVNEIEKKNVITNDQYKKSLENLKEKIETIANNSNSISNLEKKPEIPQNEKEIILDNLSLNIIQNMGKKKFETIIIKTKTQEINEIINNKKIDLKSTSRDQKNLKILLVGDKFVGKSSIIFQFISNKFDNFYITTIFKEDFCRKLKIGENEYNICLSSLSGDPLYKEDYNDIYEFADIFLLVFDVTNHESFNRLEDILRKDIRKYVGLIEEKQPNFFLVGNKCELKDKKVTDLEINEFCKKYNLEYFEVSAKNNRNIIKTFTRISEICDKIIHGKND